MTGDTPWVLHVDLDEFIAAVEVLRRPELAGRPVVVGGRGDPTERGVVATANYAAREFGVGSGMPLRVAVRKCPEAVFLPVDKPAYEAASQEVMATVSTLRWGGARVAVQVLGWDEAFVGPAPASHHPSDDPVEVAEALRARVLAATQLTCCVGIGDNVLRAKLATGLAKATRDPALRAEGSVGTAVATVTEQDWFPLFGERPTTALWGIGGKTAQKLSAIGIETVAQLAAADATTLAATFGPTTGPWLGRLGRGQASTTVDPTPWVARGHSREETFQSDLVDRATIEAEIRRIAGRVADDIAAENRPAIRVELKIRLAPFITLIRSHKLPQPSSDPELLGAEAVALLERLDQRDRDRPVRLLGVRLEMADPADYNQEVERRQRRGSQRE